MTDEQRSKIRNLRAAGLGYKKIAEQMGVSENTVKTYCRRHGLGGTIAMQEKDESVKTCLQCGTVVMQPPGRKQKKFCSDKCRNAWWKAHPEQINRKAVYSYECAFCKKPFTAYGNFRRRYCCHACFVADKFGGGSHEQ